MAITTTATIAATATVRRSNPDPLNRTPEPPPGSGADSTALAAKVALPRDPTGPSAGSRGAFAGTGESFTGSGGTSAGGGRRFAGSGGPFTGGGGVS
jgi:hypothetical protein